MDSYRVDPVLENEAYVAWLNETYELQRDTAEYDPPPDLEDVENEDCMD